MVEGLLSAFTGYLAVQELSVVLEPASPSSLLSL
jgi:hypothetical protein